MDRDHFHHADPTNNAPTDKAAAFAGLAVAVLVAAIATVPAHWFIAVLMLVVLAMPAALLVEPFWQAWREQGDLQTP